MDQHRLINKIVSILFRCSTSVLLYSQLLACTHSTSTNVVGEDSIFFYKIPYNQIQAFQLEKEVQFWHYAMQLSPDSVLIYTQQKRQVLAKLPKKEVLNFKDSCCKDSVFHNFRFHNNLPYNLPLRYLEGKSNFYQWEQVKEYIKPAGSIFSELDVNPIYAQFVLLVECPANPRGRSSAGAVGHFQLMPFVAKKYGLKVSEEEDERTDLKKGAYAAAMHFKHYCIPMANRILAKHNIPVEENELWYQLFVLHIYNAGAGNVSKVMELVPPQTAGAEIIKQLWHTSAGGFKNSSQNYTQIAIAAYLNFVSKS